MKTLFLPMLGLVVILHSGKTIDGDLYRHSSHISDPEKLRTFIRETKANGMDNLVVYTCMNLITDLTRRALHGGVDWQRGD